MSDSARAKFQTDAPPMFEKGEEKNPRKKFKGHKRHPSGKSGKGHVKTPKRRGGRS